MRDFTLAKYIELCRALREAGYPGVTIGDYLSREIPLSERVVMLRHDVDSRPAHSVKLAMVEQQQGFAATYFYRTLPGLLDPRTIARVAEMGHEVGYHYETLSQTRGNLDEAIALFGRELERLRQYAPVRVASMHGSPLKPWDNRDIWTKCQPADFGLVGEVYRDLDYTRVSYFSDTGRTWNPQRYNLRDHVSRPAAHAVETTDELIGLIRSQQLTHLCLLTHPERWAGGLGEWMVQAARDVGINAVKMVIMRLRPL